MLSGQFLKAHRTAKELSRPKAAKALKVSIWSIDTWENSRVLPNNKSLKKMMKLYGFTIEEYIECLRVTLRQHSERRIEELRKKCK